MLQTKYFSTTVQYGHPIKDYDELITEGNM